MNNQKSIVPIIVVLTIVVLLVGGILAWQYFRTPKEKVEKFQEKMPEEAAKVLEEAKIPSDIALNNEELKNFLINYKIQNETGFISSQIIGEDLNKDGLDEIIIGFTYGGPSVGWIGLIAKDGEEYKIINWEEVFPTVSEMGLRNISNDKYQALVVKLAGGGGTGIFYQKMLVYVYINNQIKLTFNEYIERTEVDSIGIMNNYEIDFKDIDYNGDIEIIQKGTEKEVEWSYEKNDYVPIKEVSVKNVFKWDEKEKIFKEI